MKGDPTRDLRQGPPINEETHVSKPKPLYSATISYRTPAGRRVLYGTVVAANNPVECENKLRLRLQAEERYGRRRIVNILDDFSALFFAMQTPVRRAT